MKNSNIDFNLLADQIWNNVHTQVQKNSLLDLKKIGDTIIEQDITGDVVEVGIWEGGCIAFLSKVFENTNKTIWAVDSFNGFQDPTESKYKYNNQRHTPQIHKSLENSVWIRDAPSIQVPLERVKTNLKKYNIDSESNVKFLKGFANQVLQPEICPIKEISLLRIDVDAYSTTREVLEFLYHKVTPNGFIIFDDWGVQEAQEGIFDFFKQANIPIPFNFHPEQRCPFFQKK